ncbi:hypothetical protein ACFFOS_03520 [Nocardioides kongjuensis]|uniref:Uncharacterized protein n=1 Tax=Nocardioides kongjuensis TaxID=349522 RepID=A0A852R252_9ACTN|nr:hypothetical protein [Nocardioides kongjuensis]NYD28843.1 hypothetical protein [Nocardioides kongjuensis]
MSSSDDKFTAADDAAVDRGRTTPGASRSLTAARVRDNIARVVWVVCMALALVLAVAAFTYALEANQDNGLVKLVRDLADTFDLSVFDLDNPVKAFTGKNAVVKTALFNYGLASVVYLVIGRVLERIIRP